MLDVCGDAVLAVLHRGALGHAPDPELGRRVDGLPGHACRSTSALCNWTSRATACRKRIGGEGVRTSLARDGRGAVRLARGHARRVRAAEYALVLHADGKVLCRQRLRGP